MLEVRVYDESVLVKREDGFWERDNLSDAWFILLNSIRSRDKVKITDMRKLLAPSGDLSCTVGCKGGNKDYDWSFRLP